MSLDWGSPMGFTTYLCTFTLSILAFSNCWALRFWSMTSKRYWISTFPAWDTHKWACPAQNDRFKEQRQPNHSLNECVKNYVTGFWAYYSKQHEVQPLGWLLQTVLQMLFFFHFENNPSELCSVGLVDNTACDDENGNNHPASKLHAVD